MFKGVCKLILAENDAFTSADDAFNAYESGDRSKIIDVREQKNIVTDLGWSGLFGSNLSDYYEVHDSMGFSGSGDMSREVYIALCNATQNPSFDYRKVTNFASAGITNIYALASNASTRDMYNRKRVLTSTFSAPTSTRTINCICTQVATTFISVWNYPYSILFLDSPITQTTSTSLYCQYTFTWNISYDVTGNTRSSRVFVDFLNNEHRYGSSAYTDLYNKNRHYKYLTTKVAPSNMDLVREGCIAGIIPATYSFGNPTTADVPYYRHTYPAFTLGISTSTNLGSNWTYGRSVLSEYAGTVSFSSNKYSHSSMIIGHTDLQNTFNQTGVIKHGTTDAATASPMVNPTLTPPPTSVAVTQINPDPAITDTFSNITMYITRGGDASNINLCTVTSFNPIDSSVTLSIPGGYEFDTTLLVNLPSVVFTTTGSLPTGLSVNTTYYAKAISGNVIQLSLTDTGDSMVTFTDSGTGTTTLERTATAKAYISKEVHDSLIYQQLMPVNPMIDGIPHNGGFPYRFMQSIAGYYKYGDNVYIIYNNSTTDTPAMYLLRWKFNSIEHSECVMTLPDNFIFTAAVVGNSLWCAGKTGLYIINLDTLSQTEVLTSANGLLETQCVHIEEYKNKYYIFHRNSITVLDSTKNIVTTFSNSVLNPNNAQDFLVGTINMINDCIIWGDIKPMNRLSGGGSNTGYVKVFNMNTNTVATITSKFSGTYAYGGLLAPSAVFVEPITSTSIKMVIIMATSGNDGEWYWYMGYRVYNYDIPSNTFTLLNEYVDPNNTSCNAQSATGTTKYRSFIGMHQNKTTTGTRILNFYHYSGESTVKGIITAYHLNLSTYALTKDLNVEHITANHPVMPALQFDSANVHYKYSACYGYTHKSIKINGGNNRFQHNGYKNLLPLTMYWDDVTGQWIESPVACCVKPTIQLSGMESITVANTSPNIYSPQSQLIIGESVNNFYGYGFIKKNSQSAYISGLPSVYIGTMNVVTVSLTITESTTTYTIPEKSNINFRILVDNETVATVGGVSLVRTTSAPTGTQYQVNTTGTINFGSSLIGQTVNVTYVIISRN